MKVERILLAGAILVMMLFIPLPSADAEDVQYPAYDALDKDQKSVYDSLSKGVPAYSKHINVRSIPLKDGSLAMEAFMSDHPEYFWFKTSYSLYYDPISGNITEFRADSLDVTEIKSKISQLQSVVSGFMPSGSSYADKVRSIHDWIAFSTSYNLETENSGNVYGTLVEGKARCEGYAYTMSYLCNMYGIPCVYVFGTVDGYDGLHAWNIVEMDNSRWYYVDVTWDDEKCPDTVGYGYFLVGSDTPTLSGIFGKVHHPEYEYGIVASANRYDYDPYPHGKDIDSISLSLEDVKKNISKKGSWYYPILDSKLFYDEVSMTSLAHYMERVSADYWSISLQELPPSQFIDKDAKDYRIRMYLDDQEVTPYEIGIAGHMKIEFSRTSSDFLSTAKFYDSNGVFISSGETLVLKDMGTFTKIYEPFSITENPILIIVAVILVILMMLLIVRNRLRVRAIRNGYRNPEGARICRQCGGRIDKGEDFCPRCGNLVPKK